MFRGEKSVLFYIGLIILGYSVYQFFWAGWQIVLHSLIYSSSDSIIVGEHWLLVIPSIVQGVIFLIIGLYLMRAGTVKKELKTEK